MAKAETIVSAANPLVKEVRKAIARGTLTPQGWCVAESFHLLDEALRSACEVPVVLAAESSRAGAEARLRNRAVRLLVLPDPLFQSLSSTETAQGVIALVNPPAWTIDHLFLGCPLILVLDGLQDPGNAGAIIRAAEAFGATGALFLKGAVSPFNPKSLRASAGSLFRVPFLHGVEPAGALDAFRQHQVDLLASVPAHQCSTHRALTAVDLKRPCALIIGSEGHGVSPALRAAARTISIPTLGVESLNAALASAILLYEARRQRTGTP